MEALIQTVNKTEQNKGLNNLQLVIEINEVFDLMCKSTHGAISRSDFKLALKALGLELPRNQYIKLITRIQKDNEGFIIKEVFIKEVQKLLSQTNNKNDIIKAFRLFDEDDTGKIDFNNLNNVAMLLGEQVSDQEIMNMLNAADNDGDGQVNLTEFMRLIDNAKKNL